MSSHALIKTALEAHAALAALVGTRIRPDLAQADDDYPFVIFKRSDLDISYHLNGSISTKREVFEVECWGRSRSEAINVFEQALGALLAAELEPERGEPDGIDPELLERVNVITVDVWS